jgi:NADPH:quinone reductase-like Zn-dependent oxidoreductase
MKAIEVQEESGKPVHKWGEVPDVELLAPLVKVDVYSTAINRADLAQARGAYPPPEGESSILGLEMAGIVTDTGSGISKWQVGDRVFSLLGGGGYAESVVVHEDMLLPIPKGWNFHQAASIPEAWLTAFVNLFLEGRLQKGENVLIHAGASGVGTAAIQLAKSAGAIVITTAGTNKKVEACGVLGADLAVNYNESDFRGSIGLLGGVYGKLNMSHVLGKRLHIVGSRLRHRPLLEKVKISRSFWERFQPLFLIGGLRPVIDTVYPIEEAQAAHEYVYKNRNIGKVVLAVRD